MNMTTTLLEAPDVAAAANATRAAGQSVHVAAAKWQMANGRRPIPTPPHPLTLRSNAPETRKLWQEWLSRLDGESVSKPGRE